MPANITYGPVAAVAARPVVRGSRRKPPHLSTEQRKEMAAKSSAKQAQLNADIETWHRDARAYAQKLSEKYGKKEEVYLRLMFSAGAKLQTKRKPNAFNAWSHHLAQEANEGATVRSATHLLELQRENIQQYHDLTEAEKAELISQLEEERDSRSGGLRQTPRSRVRDVDNACKAIDAILLGLKRHAGTEAFYCIVRNTPDYYMEPRWYFSTPAIDNYLRGAIRKGWDPEIIGSLTEAFAVARCDFMNFLRTAKSKADWMKGEILDKINAMLVKITGNKKVVMNYVNYERDIVLRHGVELRGWTHDKFSNPSNLSTSLPLLRILLNAIENGDCKFVRLSAAELKAKEKDYDHRVAAGEVPARKQRKDAGGTHAKRGKKRALRPERDNSEDSSSDSSGDEEPPQRRRCKTRTNPKSAAVVPDDVDEDDGAAVTSGGGSGGDGVAAVTMEGVATNSAASSE